MTWRDTDPGALVVATVWPGQSRGEVVPSSSGTSALVAAKEHG